MNSQSEESSARRFLKIRLSVNENWRWSNVSLRAMLVAATLLCVWVAAFRSPVRRFEPQVVDRSEEIRELERQLHDLATREFAAERLGYLGREANSAETSLLQAAEAVSPDVRARAVWALSRVSGREDLLKPLVTNRDYGVRMAAAEGLLWNGYDPRKLLGMLSDCGEARTFSYICDALGPEEAAAVVPLLLDSLPSEDEDPERPYRHDAATEALIHVALPAPTAVPALIERLGNERAQVRTAAAEQLLRLGPLAKAAAPALRARLHDPNPGCAAACAAAIGAIDPDDDEFLAVLKASLRTEDFAVRQRVAAYLWMLGPAGAGASDDLVAYLCDFPRRVGPYYDVNALKRIGPAAVSALDRALNEAVIVRDHALPCPIEHRAWLWNLGWTAKSKLMSAICRLEYGATRNRDVNRFANHPFQTMMRLAKIRLMECALHMASIAAMPEPRYLIPAWLGTIGPRAAPAVPTLIAVVDRGDFQFNDFSQYSAIQALGTTGEDAAPAIPHLLPLLDSDNAVLRGAALRALRQIGVSGEDVRARLRRFLASSDKNERLEAACLLAQSGEPVDRILPLLINEAAQQSSNAYLFFEPILSSMASFGPAAVPGLIVALQSDDPSVREVAAAALGKIGPEASAAVPYLIALLDTETSWDAAAEALGEIGPSARAAVPKLLEILESFLSPVEPLGDDPASDDPDEDAAADDSPEDNTGRYDPDASIYIALLHALGGIGQSARIAAPTVLNLAHSDDPSVRHIAVQTLARIDARNPSLFGLMHRWLGEWERTSATKDIDLVFDFDATLDEFVDAVSCLGTRAQSFVPRLERLMTTAPLVNPKVRCYAAYSLAQFPSHRAAAENYLKLVRKVGLSDDFETINLADTLLQRLEGVEKTWTRLFMPHGVGP